MSAKAAATKRLEIVRVLDPEVVLGATAAVVPAAVLVGAAVVTAAAAGVVATTAAGVVAAAAELASIHQGQCSRYGI